MGVFVSVCEYSKPNVDVARPKGQAIKFGRS